MYCDNLCFGFILNVYLKNVYHESRPCWTDKEIPLLGYEMDYGHPSVHASLCGSSILPALFIYAFENTDFTLNNYELVDYKKLRLRIIYKLPIRIIISVISILIYIFIIYSRLYVGAHSINQILYGPLLSIWWTVCIFIVFRTELVSYHQYVLTDQTESYFKPGVIGTIILFVILTLIGVITYLIQSAIDIEVNEYEVNHIKEYIEDFEKEDPLDSGLINFGFVGLIFGVHMGIYIGKKYLKIDPTRITIPTAIWKIIIRLLATTIVAAIIPAIMFLLVPSSPAIGFMWIKSFIPSILLSFTLIGFGEFIIIKLNCYLNQA